MPCIKVRWLWKRIQYMPEFLGVILYFIYTMSVPVFEQYFFKHYSEKYGYNYSMDISSKGTCNNDNTTDPVLLKVQDAVSIFLADNSFCFLVPSIIFGLFYGPLSDRVGRKPVLLLNVSGFLIMIAAVIVVDIFKLDLFFVHLGSVFFGIGGYFTVGSVILQTYLSDVVEGDKLPARIGMLNMVLFFSLAVSNFISGIILRTFGFLISFSIIGILAVIVILLTLFQLTESLPKEKRSNHGSWLHVPKQIYMLLKVRRVDKWIFYFMVPLEVFAAIVQQEEGVVLLRLLNKPFCFSPVDIGVFRGTVYMSTGIGSAILIQYLPKLTHKVCVVVVAFLSSSAYNVTFGLATSKFYVYMAVVGGIFSNAHTPISRGILTNSVTDSERGTMFGCLSTLISIVQLISSYTNQYFYRLSDDNGNPGNVFIGIGMIPILPIMVALFYIVKDKSKNKVMIMKEEEPISEHDNDIEDELTASINSSTTAPLIS